MGGLARYDASGIGRVISNERVPYGIYYFSTRTYSLDNENHSNVVEV